MKKTLFLLPFLLFALAPASALIPPPPPAAVEAAMGNESEDCLDTPETDTASLGNAASLNLVAPPPPSETETPWASFAKAGYSSNYDYKGMVVPAALCRHGEMNYALGTDYSLSNGMILTSALNYADLFGGALNAKNETRFSLGLKDEILPDLTLYYGYGLVHGGIAGQYARLAGAAHSLVQEFNFSAYYRFGISGWFAGLETSYSFQGLTGWWLTGVVGYKYEFSETFHALLTGSASSSWSYWPADGCNQVSVKLEMPYTLHDSWTLTPFLSSNWLGRAGLKMNSQSGEPVFRPFTLMAGASVTYTF